MASSMRKMRPAWTSPGTKSPLLSKISRSESKSNAQKDYNGSYVLVMGRSGKHNQKFADDVQHSRNRTTLAQRPPQLFVTDGFDSLVKSDVDVFTGTAVNLLHENINQSISGIVVIFPATDRISSRSLQRILKGLVDLFLGKDNLNRLTILVMGEGLNKKDPKSLATMMRKDTKKAPLFAELHSGGAIITAFNQGDPIGHLKCYFSQDPISLPIYQPDSNQETRSRVESALESVDLRALDQQKELTEALKKSEEEALHYKTRFEQANQSLGHYKADQLQLLANQQKMEEEIAQCRAESEKLAQLHVIHPPVNTLQSNGDAHDPSRVPQLIQRLQQVEAEYASLRSQIQLHNNYEQGEISQDLKNLNGMIERLGQSTSEYLVDNYVEATFHKESDGVTTLDARDLTRLKDIFGHREGSSSLIASADGGGLNIENFIDFSIRAQICYWLVRNVFEPFHPFIDPIESSKYTTTYEQVRKAEPQYTAGKWRSVTFKNICNPSGQHAPTGEEINQFTERLLRSILEPLAKGVFGCSTKQLGIPEQRRADLKEIVTTAWEWTSKVKSEVILLGDFQPTAFDVRKGPVYFDSQTMEDYERSARGPHPRAALCTLGLGLCSSQARGRGESPKWGTVHKAMVLTDTYHDQI